MRYYEKAAKQQLYNLIDTHRYLKIFIRPLRLKPTQPRRNVIAGK